MSDYSTYHRTEYSFDLEYCKQFIFSFGSNYALGTRLFNKRVREATIFFYAFVRYADELVDNPDQQMPGQAHSNLDEFINEWNRSVKHKDVSHAHPVIRSTYFLFLEYNIPFNYIDDFLFAMKQDMTQFRYKTYAELEHYMWGSASIVGHVMTFIVGYSDVIAFEYAKSLGEAMQLANFTRDINEDYQERNRIYIPQIYMRTFGVDESMIKNQLMTEPLRNLVCHMLVMTEKLFDQGITGIRQLQSGKFSILLASRMYRENIRILARRDYNIFGPKIRLSNWQKVIIFITTCFIYPFWLLRSQK